MSKFIKLLKLIILHFGIFLLAKILNFHKNLSLYNNDFRFKILPKNKAR